MKKSAFAIFFLAASLMHADEKSGFRGQGRGSLLKPDPLVRALTLIKSGVNDRTNAYQIYSALNYPQTPCCFKFNGGEIQIVIKQQSKTGNIYVTVKQDDKSIFMDQVIFPNNIST